MSVWLVRVPLKMKQITILAALVAAAISYIFGYNKYKSVLLSFFVLGIFSDTFRFVVDLLWKTLPRDLRGLKAFIRINLLLWWWEKRSYTVPQIWRDLVKKQPEKTAFLFEDQKWTFKQVEEESNRIANYFKSQGFKNGDTVALFMENQPHYVIIWLGLSKIGVVTALINSNLRQSSLVHSITIANSRGVIFGSELYQAVEEVKDSLTDRKFYQFGKDTKLLHQAVDLTDELKNCSAELSTLYKCLPREKLVYIYTSGTTGLPKAAVITHLRFMFMAYGVHCTLGVSPGDIIYDSLPLYHTAGGMLGVGQVLLCGATLVIRRKFSASNFWKDCVKYNCTVAQYIGEICRYLLSTKPVPEEKSHTVRLMFGNGLRPQIWRPFVERFGIEQIGEFYGATEGISNIVNMDSKEGAVGFIPRYATFAYPVTLVKVDEETEQPIRDKNGFCVKCGPGEVGMFVGRIDPKKALSNFNGYADRKESEKKVLHNVFKKGDQYFNSGDMLVMDEYGYFYFKDRTGDTFRWRGENVATSEVEAVISNIVGLKDAVVYGVEIPNVEGKAGMAAILDEGKNLDIKKLSDGIRDQLPSYARPLFVRVLDHLPVTGTYKLKKRDLQLDGFDRTKIKDDMYYMNAEGYYVPLTETVYKDILSGKMRL